MVGDDGCLDGGEIHLRGRRQDSPALRSYLRIEVLAKPVQTGLEAGLQAVALGATDLADPAVLQEAKHATENEESPEEQPREHASPSALPHACASASSLYGTLADCSRAIHKW
jgi:hypothetical protein